MTSGIIFAVCIFIAAVAGALLESWRESHAHKLRERRAAEIQAALDREKRNRALDIPAIWRRLDEYKADNKPIEMEEIQ